ncbi:MAG: RagB/SusD family nutrient uptake outer membrane protein [Saprospiraceae bacterium]
MKNLNKYLLITFLTLIIPFGCTDILDVAPGDAYTEVDIYKDPILTEKLVFSSYNSTESWGMNFADWWTRRMGYENASDESWFHFVPQNYKITRSAITANDQGFFNGIWRQNYLNIGPINEFLSKIDGSDVMKSHPDKAQVLKGEMLFLRAYNYFRLVNLYGGVILVDKPFGLTDDFKRPRNSYQECIDFIVKDLDEAAKLFPSSMNNRTGKDFGRVSKGACLGLKSRVLLYAASPLHDQATVPNGPLYDYTKATKWKDASDAAKALIDLNTFNLVSVKTAADYQNLHLKPNAELIFARPFNPEFPTTPADFNTLPDKAQSTVSSGGWGLSNPTHNFVQEFKMANGKRITEAGSGYTDAEMYKNRELRFYANINYQGATFRGIELEYWQPGGKDSKDIGPPNHFAGTGYNVRKFQDETVLIDKSQSANRPFPLIRLAEIYLNYAEAQFFLGNEAEARTYVNKIAQRVGLPTITTSGQALLNDIKYERQMELFFEGHRFFDLRRWMMADKLGADVTGVQWQKLDASGKLSPTGTLKRIDIPLIEDRSFNPKNYYIPIPTAEIEKAGILQNFGY